MLNGIWKSIKFHLNIAKEIPQPLHTSNLISLYFVIWSSNSLLQLEKADEKKCILNDRFFLDKKIFIHIANFNDLLTLVSQTDHKSHAKKGKVFNPRFVFIHFTCTYYSNILDKYFDLELPHGHAWLKNQDLISQL